MQRRDFLSAVGVSLLLPGPVWLSSQQRGGIDKLEKPKDQWRRLLDGKAYRVLFEEATERPFSSPLLKEKRKLPWGRSQPRFIEATPRKAVL